MPIAAIVVKSDLERLSRDFGQLGREQLPFAYSQTINRLARQAVADLRAEMEKVFDRPTPWALNAFYARLGTKKKPIAEIRTREFAGKGTPAWKYLTPEVFGGARRMKRFERALSAKFQTGMTVPGSGASLDQYGNISEADINRILSALGAFAENGYLANRARKPRGARARRQQTFFLAHTRKDGTPLGIYKVVSAGHVEPVLIFPRRAPSYRIRFRYAQVIDASVKAHLDLFAREELQKAIDTAR